MGAPAISDVESGVEEPTRFRGSPDRVSGAYFRAMAQLLLERDGVATRGELSRELRARLEARGLTLHERTIRRHLSGEVASVPPEVQQAMLDLALERTDLGSTEAVEEALAEAGLDAPAEDEREPLVRSERFMPLVELWLHLNPGRSKRSLAVRLQRDLKRAGLSFVVGSLESLLSGKGLVVRREVYQRLLDYLAEHAVAGEADAHRMASRLSESIKKSLDNRALVDPQRFQLICRAWQLRHHEASARRLSTLLRQRLAERGIKMSLNRLQKNIAGKTRRVRRVLEEVAEQLLAAELPEGVGVDHAIQGVWSHRDDVTDLFWVEAEPIARLANEWLAQHPGQTTRQLAIRISRTLEQMGFSRGHNAIQPVLGGWKKKTRGFVYHAMLAQFEDTPEVPIPEAHILEPPTQVHLALTEPDDLDEEEGAAAVAAASRQSELSVAANGNGPVAADRYLKAMRQYYPGALAPSFLAFAAFRAERLYGVPREEAEAFIRGEAESKAVRSFP